MTLDFPTSVVTSLIEVCRPELAAQRCIDPCPYLSICLDDVHNIASRRIDHVLLKDPRQTGPIHFTPRGSLKSLTFVCRNHLRVQETNTYATTHKLRTRPIRKCLRDLDRQPQASIRHGYVYMYMYVCVCVYGLRWDSNQNNKS